MIIGRKIMADSHITKRALAAALKVLMEEIPFAKISITDICDSCGMNRKSFYYHFKDKYDLVNWIFDTEFIEEAAAKDYPTFWNALLDLCEYLYENRNFYRRALKIEGQNSFHVHFHALIAKSIADELDLLFGPEEALEMQSTDLFITFFADGLTGMIERWITQRGCDEPEIFMAQLRLFFAKVAFEVYRGLDEENTK